MIFRFHPLETQSPTGVISTETSPYVSYGTERRGDVLYDVTTFQMYYRNNLAIGCGWQLFPNSYVLGFHPHDVEWVSIYSLGGTPVKVYFSAHSRGQGVWVDWEDCERIENHLVCYVARGSHAMYPYPGTYYRVFALANDCCSKFGRTMVVNEYTPAYDFGFSDGIRLYKSLRPPPPDTSITRWQRFLLPFVSLS